jgi:hypothetical protein
LGRHLVKIKPREAQVVSDRPKVTAGVDELLDIVQMVTAKASMGVPSLP